VPVETDPTKLIICPTHRRYERYCDHLISMLDRLWPGHPEVWLITDGGGVKHPNKVVVENEPGWVGILHAGIRRIFSQQGQPEHVFLVLEDLLPIHECDFERFSRVLGIAGKESLNCVVFPCFPLPERMGKSVQFGGEVMYEADGGVMPYSQLQAAVWKTTHLLETCEWAMAHRQHEPWDFEQIRISGGHYISELRWPTVYHGLFHNKLVNRLAFSSIQLPEGRGLYLALLGHFVTEIPFRVWRRIRAVEKSR
jgi:hypothetical protein